MNGSKSLHLDEHLARLLAAFDQRIDSGDGRAPTIDVPALPDLGAGERLVEPLSGSRVNQGSFSNLLPDSHSDDPFAANGLTTEPLQETHHIGRFELRKQLGKGGCGIVFLAYDPKLKRDVALKIPRPELLLSSDARRRLLREATAAASFDHPNLVPVYEIGEIGPVCFVATVFCPGQTLSEWLERQSFPVPVRQAARLVAQLAEAVQHAHDRSVLHRDLKPNNVILQEIRADPNSQEAPPGACPLRGDFFIPRVVDFGLAKLTDQGPGETAARQVLGTPKYMAPEQAQARHEDVGPEADVYALGVILYEMLAGRTPYEGASDVEVLRLSIEGHLTLPRALRAEIPRDLEAICLKAMARTPARRYRTAIDLADDLRRFLDGLPTIARPLNALGRAGRWLRRNDQVFALIVLSTICCILLGIGMLNAYQNGKFRVVQNESQVRDAERIRLEYRREYARHVRDAFLGWRAGDSRQAANSLRDARLAAGMNQEAPEFAANYLAHLGQNEQASVACPAGKPLAFAVSLTGPWLATGHGDGTLAIWRRENRAPTDSVKAHAAGVTHVAFIDGGSKIVSAGAEASARVWSIDARGRLQPEIELPALAAPISALAASTASSIVVLGSNRGDGLVWNAQDRQVVRSWAVANGEPVTAIAVTPDGKSIATVAHGQSIRIGNAARSAPPGEVAGSRGAKVLGFVPLRAGWLLAAGYEDGVIRLFDEQRREVRQLAGHAGSVLVVQASRDGSALASGGEDGAVCVWNVAAGSRRLLLGHEQPVRGIGFAPDGRSLFSAADDGLLKTWNLIAEPEGITRRDLPAAVSIVATRFEGSEYAVAYADGPVELFAQRGAASRSFPAQGRTALTALRYPDSGPPLGVELGRRTAMLWEFGDTARIVFRVDIAAAAADLHPSAQLLAVGDNRGRITVWSLSDRSVQYTFDTGQSNPVRYLAFSESGNWLAAETADRAIGVWHLGEPTPRAKIAAPGEGTRIVRFIGNDRIVSAGRGSSIKIWNVASGKEEWTLLGHVGRVTTMAITPDLRTLVSGAVSGDVKLWDLRTGQELIGLRRHGGPVLAAEFSGDGRLLITGGGFGPLRGELAFWEGQE